MEQNGTKIKKIWDDLKPLLSQSVIEKLETSKVTVLEDENFKVYFVGARAKQTEEGLKILAKRITNVSSRFKIIGTMSEAMELELSSLDDKLQVIYIAFDKNDSETIEQEIRNKSEFFFVENEFPSL